MADNQQIVVPFILRQLGAKGSVSPTDIVGLSDAAGNILLKTSIQQLVLGSGVSYDNENYKGAFTPSQEAPSNPGNKPIWGDVGRSDTDQTFVNFGNITVHAADSPGKLTYNGAEWSYIKGLNASGLMASGDFDGTGEDLNNKKADKTAVQKPIDIASQKFDQVDNTYTKTGESYDTKVYNSIPLNPIGFNGWDTPVGVQKNFNCVRFNITTQSVAPTEIWVKIAVGSKTGTVLQEKHLTGLSLPANSLVPIEVIFDEIIENVDGDQLRFMYVCNKNITRDGHNPNPLPYNNVDYAIASYRSDGTLNWDFKDATINGTENIANYVEFYLFGTEYKANQSLIADIAAEIEGLQDLPDTTNKVTSAIITEVSVDGSATVLNPSSTFLNNSTFSGFGSSIGVQTGFTILQGRMGARETPITQVAWELREESKTGPIKLSGTINMVIAPNTFENVNVLLDAPYDNSAGKVLWFGLKANQLANDWGTNTGTITDPDPGYVTNGALGTVWSVNTRPDWNIWVNVGTVESKVVPSDEFTDGIREKLGDIGNHDFAEIILASELYATEAHETNVYFDNVINSNLPLAALDIDITCTRGAHLARGFRITPVAADAGTLNLTIKVSYNGNLLANYSGKIRLAAATAGAGKTIKINFWGDSTLSSGQPQLIIIAEDAEDDMHIEFQGTLGSGPNKYEGRGGYSISDYATIGRTLYKFPFTGVTTAPGVGAVYSTNGSSFTVVEVNIVDGDGYISATRTSGSNDPATNGTLTRVSGAGDATVSFTGSSITSANPLWDGTKINYGNYLTTNGITMSAGDIVALNLGINDVFNIYDDISLNAKLDTMVTQLRSIIASVKSAVPGIIFAVMLPYCPAISQDAAGENYTTGQTLKRYLRNIQMWQKRLISEFDKQTERDGNTYLVSFNAIIDRTYNFPHSLVNANARNSTDQVMTWHNLVHPTQSGYDQGGDALKAFAKVISA